LEWSLIAGTATEQEYRHIITRREIRSTRINMTHYLKMTERWKTVQGARAKVGSPTSAIRIEINKTKRKGHMENNNEILDKTIGSLTVKEFLEVMELQLKEITENTTKATNTQEKPDVTCKYVYGLDGIAKLFNCSRTTANRIKQSGRIDKAVQQLGRQIVINADYAIELAGKSSKFLQ